MMVTKYVGSCCYPTVPFHFLPQHVIFNHPAITPINTLILHVRELRIISYSQYLIILRSKNYWQGRGEGSGSYEAYSENLHLRTVLADASYHHPPPIQIKKKLTQFSSWRKSMTFLLRVIFDLGPLKGSIIRKHSYSIHLGYFLIG